MFGCLLPSSLFRYRHCRSAGSVGLTAHHVLNVYDLWPLRDLHHIRGEILLITLKQKQYGYTQCTNNLANFEFLQTYDTQGSYCSNGWEINNNKIQSLTSDFGLALNISVIFLCLYTSLMAIIFLCSQSGWAILGTGFETFKWEHDICMGRKDYVLSSKERQWF